jgi:catechol 1,2-dioxygenase
MAKKGIKKAPTKVEEKTMKALAKKASGLGAKKGNKRLQAITNRILMDLFKTMQDYKITPDEAWSAVSYFSTLGHEAGLLTPGLGIEHFIDLLQDAADAKAGLKGGTPRTIEGPLYIAGAPISDGYARLDDGTDKAEVLMVSGQITGKDGKALRNAVVDVWHANSMGMYSHFDASQSKYNLRRRIRTDADGRYSFRTILPVGYGCPPGGPTETLLKKLGRHSQRPSHVHFFVSAKGHRQLTTQFNLAGDPLTYDDFAFATRNELVADVNRVKDKARIAELELVGPFNEITFDFELQPSKKGAPDSIVRRDRVSIG